MGGRDRAVLRRSSYLQRVAERQRHPERLVVHESEGHRIGGRHADAVRMFEAGASLVQVYTGLLFRGPGLVRSINRVWARRPEHLRSPAIAEEARR